MLYYSDGYFRSYMIITPFNFRLNVGAGVIAMLAVLAKAQTRVWQSHYQKKICGRYPVLDTVIESVHG